jgi:hypothetical protein
LKLRKDSGNASYHSLKNPVPSPALSENQNIKIFVTVILPVVVYECETWSLTLREEHKLRVFQKRVLRRIFGPKRDEVTEGWKKLHNKELHNLYCSPNIIRTIKSRRMSWAGHVARMRKWKMRTKFWLESLKGRGHSEDLGVDVRIILK